LASIALKNISKRYDGSNALAVDNFSLEVKEGEFVVLVGPSGCGKTTALRMIAGLEKISGGELFINGVKANDISPKDRNIAMVFQNYALYPHMDAYQNMEYGLKIRKFSKPDRHRIIMKTADLLQISGLLQRRPDAMSGGERQRVALGRAMVRNPEVFLLDEPLSNLDAALRTEMRYNIMKLHKKLGATFIYVTHDQTEAMTMADSIVVMNRGRIEQADTPERIYRYPANRFVAEFIGTPKMNMLPARIEAQDGGHCLIIGDGRYEMPEGRFKKEVLDGYAGREVMAGFRAEDVLIGGKQNERALIELAETMGPETLIHINLLDNAIISRQPGIAEIPAGGATGVGFNMKNVHLFDEETGVRIGIGN